MFPDSNGWERADYEALIHCAVDGQFTPEHWLMYATIESGLSTKAQSRYAPAKGLWQAMPFVLKSLGFVPGNADYERVYGEFKNLSAERQIVWSLKYLEEWRKRFRLGAWKRPGDMYLCNFAPAFLPYKDVPLKVIFSSQKDPTTYWVNRGLDRRQNGIPLIEVKPPAKYAGEKPYVGKGHINVADMSLILMQALLNDRYRQAIRSLNKLAQEGLNKLELGQPKLVVDGNVGPLTRAALAKFWELKNFPLSDRDLNALTRLALLG